MASAFLPSVGNVTPAGSDFAIEFFVTFSGSDVRGGVDQSIVTVTITPADTVNTIRSKISAAVSAEATRLGFSVAANAMILPAFQRG